MFDKNPLHRRRQHRLHGEDLTTLPRPPVDKRERAAAAKDVARLTRRHDRTWDKVAAATGCSREDVKKVAFSRAYSQKGRTSREIANCAGVSLDTAARVTKELRRRNWP